MEKHTPGPWRISPSGGLIQQVNGGPLNCVCRGFGRDDESFPNWQANARLIAAAPELLAALQAIVGLNIEQDGATCDWTELIFAIASARAAVAKATGQTETHDEQEP